MRRVFLSLSLLLSLSPLFLAGQAAQTHRFDFSAPATRLSHDPCLSLHGGRLGLAEACPADHLTLAPVAITLRERTPYLLLSLRWTTDAQASDLVISYRVAGRAGTWQDWQPLPADPHLSDTPTRAISQLATLPLDAQQVQLRLHFHQPQAWLDTLALRLFAPGHADHRPTRSTTADASCDRPAFVPQSSWRCPPCATAPAMPPTYTPTTHLVIHHTAGNPAPPYDAQVLGIWDLHVNVNGWDDIGYNWLIAPDGTLYEGRAGGDHARGAHMCARNGNTMGVALMGNFTNSQPTDTALATLRALLTWRANLLALNPQDSAFHPSANQVLPHLLGHRDGCPPGYTVCPGNAFYPTLVSLRDSVATQLTACPDSLHFAGDLFLTSRNVGAPTVAAGDSFTVSYAQYFSHRVDTSRSVEVGMLLSADCLLDSSDQLLARDTSLIASNAAALGRSVKLRMPPSVAPDNYQVLFVADYSDSLAESDERNNLVCRAVNVSAVQALPSAPRSDWLSVAPNPFDQQLTLRLTLPVRRAASWRLTDLMGRTVTQGTLPAHQTEQTLSVPANLPDGLYHLTVQQGSQRAVWPVVKR